MNEEIYSDIAIEQVAKTRFGLDIDVDSVIVRSVDVSRTAKATVFLTKKKQLFAYVFGPSTLLLSDVQKILSRMGLKAELYLPPKGQPDYFDAVGRRKFLEVFPGRKDVAASDLVFYRTLAPYNPALVIIEEVKNGTIKCFDSDASGGWRVAAKFAYRRIKTS